MSTETIDGNFPLDLKVEVEVIEEMTQEQLEAVRSGQDRLTQGLQLITDELHSQVKQFPRPMASLHEAYAVLLEEVDEVWDIVRQKSSARDPDELRKELVQVSAYALRIVLEMELLESDLAEQEEGRDK